MKKILIVNNNMHIGGIQKALLNLLDEIKGKYDVTLLLFCKIGELSESIPKEIKVKEPGKRLRILGMTHAEAKADGIFTLIRRSFWTVLTRIFKTRVTFNLLTRLCSLGEYDCAVAFMQNGDESVFYGGCAELVLNSVKSENKVCFIHCDFLNYGGNNRYNRETLKKFDKVAAVSESVGKKLLKAVPELCDKLCVVHNCVNYKEIEILKNEYNPDYSDCINLFTAARLHREKGILRMIPIFKHIKDKGIDFVWRIAGDGPERNEAAAMIKEYGLENEIKLLGNLVNPYPHFYRSDIVLVPSYDEAAPMVFSEAEALGTRVFTTDTTSAAEMVGDSGWVCANSDEEIEKALADVLESYTKSKLPITKKDNRTAVEEFEKMIGKKG